MLENLILVRFGSTSFLFKYFELIWWVFGRRRTKNQIYRTELRFSCIYQHFKITLSQDFCTKMEPSRKYDVVHIVWEDRTHCFSALFWYFSFFGPGIPDHQKILRTWNLIIWIIWCAGWKPDLSLICLAASVHVSFLWNSRLGAAIQFIETKNGSQNDVRENALIWLVERNQNQF